MPIVSLLSQTSFDPEMTDILTSAFDVAWERIKNSSSLLAADEAAATRETLAKHIIASAQAGERDKNRIIDRALSQLTLDPAKRPSRAGDGSAA